MHVTGLSNVEGEPNSQLVFERLLESSRGRPAHLGEFLNLYRGYLRSIADRELSRQLKAKVAPSDLVQETMLRASRAFAEFRGTTEREFVAWLTTILKAYSRDMVDRYRFSAKRNVNREISLSDCSLDSQDLSPLADNGPSPSAIAQKNELNTLLERMLKTLSEKERRVIELRHFQRLGFDEIGQILGRSTQAVQKQWARTIVKLGKMLEEHDPDMNQRTPS